jgi:hypothetical protein
MRPELILQIRATNVAIKCCIAPARCIYCLPKKEYTRIISTSCSYCLKGIPCISATICNYCLQKITLYGFYQLQLLSSKEISVVCTICSYCL